MRHLAASLLCALLGCAAGPGTPGAAPGSRGDGEGGGSGGAVAGGFPAQEALEELTSQPLPPASALATRFRDVDEWTLTGPFPDEVSAAPRPAGGVLDAIVDRFVAERAGLVVATASMDCVARELGLFLVAERGLPAEAMQRFVAGRCAVATAPPTFASSSWTTSKDIEAEEAVSTLGPEIEQRLRDHVVGGPLELGLWLHAGSGRVDLVIATGERHVRVDSVPSVPGPDGRVVLKGELLRPVEYAGASATRGRFEWSECEADAAAALPRFHLVCTVDPADPSAWISLDYHVPGRLLGSVALSLLVRPQGDEARVFRRSAYAPPRSVSDPAALPAAFSEVLNQVRASAGLRPLTLDPAQSRAAERMAPFYFASLFGETGASVAELIALGMLAGWDVEGTVQDGHFAWGWLVESLDVSRLISDGLEHPGARSALLDRDAERVAVGSLVGSGDEKDSAYLAVITSTYTLFSEATHRRDAERVRELFTEARAAQGRSAPGDLDEARPLTVEAAARVQAGEDPRDVLGDLIQSGAEQLQRSVVGWMTETQDLESLVFPADFLAREDLDLAVAVPVQQPEGQAWGRYVVLLLAAEPPQRSL